MKIILLLSLLYLSPLFSIDKKLILAEGNSWFSHMARNFVPSHDYIAKLPFSGFVMVGNSYTDLVMQKGRVLTYKKIWDEVKEMKNLYPNKEMFLQVNIHFPADFWDDKAWNQVSQNFAIVAKVAKELGFKGIVFDDEPYSKEAHKMINFKFPTTKEIQRNPKKYSSWETKGSKIDWVDKEAYRNPKYSFKEHIEKVTARFNHIMQNMLHNYPDLTILVYLGPSMSHENSNKNYPIVINMGQPCIHEFHGAIFTGLKQGLSLQASLHDMGESYKYRQNKHFGYAYQWRKFDIANDKYNNLDANYHWVVPKSERASWSTEVNVGFMVSNLGQKSNYEEYNTLNHSSREDIGETLKKALKFSDKYVIYYSKNQNWLNPASKKYQLQKGWREMMEKIYGNLH